MKKVLFTLTLCLLMEAVLAQKPLNGKKVAILSTIGFEKVELTQPLEALKQAGATVHVITPDGKPIRALEFPNWGDELPADKALKAVKASDYDALYLPGGIINPDVLRTVPEAVQFVKDFAATGRPIGSMCHGPSMLITAGLVRGRRLTSWPSIKPDLVNAGAQWEDREVVVDGNLVTSRNPQDIPALNREMVKLFANGVTARR